MSCGYSCVPACYVPVCSPPSGGTCYPVGGLGSICPGGGSGGSSGGSGGGSAMMYGPGGVSAGSLGILSGANVSCINQLPPSELVIQPAPAVLTIPGPILSASCEPVRVGGYTACGGGSSGGGSSGGSGSGGSSRGLLGSRPMTVTCSPCP